MNDTSSLSAGYAAFTSTTRSTDVDDHKHTAPPSPSPTTVEFDVAAPGRKFTLAATGRSSPHGHATTYPFDDARAAPMFNTAADAPTGTDPSPATCNSTTEPAELLPPSRVSSRRVGVNDTSSLSAGYAAFTSTTRSTDVDDHKHTAPPSPSPTTVEFDVAAPGRKFTLAATGRSSPHGHATTYPFDDARAAPMFNTAADAPTGTDPSPATCNSTTEPAELLPPSRVSSRRVGVNDTSSLSAGYAAFTSTTRSTDVDDHKHTAPPSPSPTTVEFDVAAPGRKFTLAATGRSSPHGHATTYPFDDARAAPMFNTAADAPTGTDPSPATCNSTTEPASTALDGSESATTATPAAAAMPAVAATIRDRSDPGRATA